jgi:signal transduction histidine kinase
MENQAKVLIVDDKASNLRALQIALKSCNAEIIECLSGEEALGLLLRHQFVVIILDVKMPGMSGFETAELIREHSETEQIPIIFITAYDADGKEIKKGYEFGAIDFLFKPIQKVILVSKVNIFLQLYQQSIFLANKAGKEREREKEKEITELLLKHNDALRESNRELGALYQDMDHLIDSSELGILFLDRELKIRRYTPRANDLISIRPEDIGHSLIELKIKFDGSSFITDLKTVLNTGETIEREVEAPYNKFFLQRITPFYAKEKAEVTGVVATFIDVSERVRDSKELQDVNNDLKRFAFVASHDLRGPIINMNGLIEIIKIKKWLAKEGLHIMDKLESSVLQMENTLSGLTELLDAKIGKQVESESIKISTEIERVIKNMEKQIADSNSKVTVDIDTDKVICFPAIYFQSIIQNLVTNAIKYKSVKRDCVVKITYEEAFEHKIIKVTDNSSGIDLTKNKEKLFDLFKRLNTDVEGRGIGLHLVSSLMEKHGGEADVTSVLGEGSVFIIKFNKKADGSN